MSKPESAYRIRPAKPEDQKNIQTLLLGFKLPLDGLDNTELWVLQSSEGVLLGIAGFEVYTTQGLLRSVAVNASMQNKGYGTALVNYVINEAKKVQVNDLYLLTTSAPDFFKKLGFTKQSREKVAGEIAESVEFQSACPKTAVLMHLEL